MVVCAKTVHVTLAFKVLLLRFFFTFDCIFSKKTNPQILMKRQYRIYQHYLSRVQAPYADILLFKFF